MKRAALTAENAEVAEFLEAILSSRTAGVFQKNINYPQPEFLTVLPALGSRLLNVLRQFALLLLHDQVIKERPLCLWMRLEY